MRSVVLALLALSIVPLAARAETGGVPWTDDARGAFERAGTEGKPVLVDIWATWCAPCKQMDKTTYQDAGVLEAITKFVPLKVDADLQKNFIERYRIEAFPTLLLLDAKGVEISRLLGYVGAAKLLPVLTAVAAGYPDFARLSQEKDWPGLSAFGRYLYDAGNFEGAGDAFKRALKKAPADEKPKLEVALAEAQLGAGETKTAAAAFARLATGVTDHDLRGRALLGLYRAELERGHKAEAEATLQQLQRDYPDLKP